MKLTEKPDIVNWTNTHYVFVEKVGPFQNTAPLAWKTLHQHIAELAKQSKILGQMSLYKIHPQMVYRAGAMVDGKPSKLPSGFEYVQFEGGKYSRFILTGSYSNLPQACGRVFKIIEETKLPLRDGFFIEHYVNDPKITPEDQLITEILIPTK